MVETSQPVDPCSRLHQHPDKIRHPGALMMAPRCPDDSDHA
jgi:hypothetical protein